MGNHVRTPLVPAAPGTALDPPLQMLVGVVKTGGSVSFHPIGARLAVGVPAHLAHTLDLAQHLVMEAIQS